MANTMVSFKRGSNLSNLAIADGQFIINTSERSIYVDVGTQRLRIGDFVSVANTNALPATGANETALYYVEDINCLAKWNGSGWTQINRDSGAVNFTVTGDGNAITDVSYNADTRTLTLTRGVTFTTPNVVDSKISDKVGELKIGETSYATVKAYVDQKTSGIASDADLTALTNRVATAETDIDALQAATAKGGAVSNAIADAKKAGTDAQKAADAAQSAADKAQGDVNNLAVKVGTIAEGKTVSGLISEAKTAADAAQRDVDALEAKVGSVPDGNNVVKMIGDVDTAYKAKDAELAASIKTISDDYLTSDDKTALETAIGKKVDQTTYDSKVAELVSADTTLQGNIDAEKTAREKADTAQVTRIANLESKITGLTGAMHFEGVKDKLPADVSGYESGDVIIVGEKEYVFNGTKFVEFGDVSAEGDRIRALENTVGKAAEGGKPATGLIKDIADNAAAITDEVTRAKAAEKANADAAGAAQSAANTAQDDVDAIKADYLKKADKTALQGNIDTVSGRVTTLERASHTHSNKALLDTYTQTEVNLADAVAKKHSHANATVLNGITAEKVSAWDAAQANAEATADAALSAAKRDLEGKINTAKTEVEGKVTTLSGTVNSNSDAIEALQTGKANKATTLKGYGITDAYTRAQTYNKDEVDAKLTWGEF